jgi:hypothetical protein
MAWSNVKIHSWDQLRFVILMKQNAQERSPATREDANGKPGTPTFEVEHRIAA